MKSAPIAYCMGIPGIAMIAAIVVLRDLQVPVLWSIAIAATMWAWLVLLLWSTTLQALSGPSDERSARRLRR